ncbi:MAG: hypothetical protein RIA65_16530 [Woeseia sp.]
MQNKSIASATEWHQPPRIVALAGALLAFSGFAGTAIGAEPPPDGRIGYVLTDRHWELFETEDGAAECPQGFNLGPREQFSEEFPDDGVERTVAETRLLREGRQWHPTIVEADPFPFHAAQGNKVDGLNLDGVVGDDDFQSVDGQTTGIDNQLNRVIGCIAHYRAGGIIRHFENKFAQQYNDNRWIIELTHVDDLANDKEVTVNIYRGIDDLLTDASGEAFIAGATQRVDTRWGQQYMAQTTGEIVDGVLTTEAIDTVKIPWSSTFDTSGYQMFRGLRLKLDLSAEGADGMLAGYTDVEKFNHQLNTTWSTHHQSYGQLSSVSQYHALRRFADGYPDPDTGANTAISSAVKVKMKRVIILHQDEAYPTVAARAESGG